MYTFFEHSIYVDKINLKYDVANANIIYQESSGSIFDNITTIFNGYMADRKNLKRLYKERKQIEKGVHFIERVCNRNPSIGKTKILIRSYNDKFVNSEDVKERMLILRNLVANSRLKITNPVISSYFDNYNLYKAGWDKYYEMELRYVPGMFYKMENDIDGLIEDLKETMKDLSHYLDQDTGEKIEDKRNVFEKIATYFKEAINHRLNIMSMNVEAIQYEIGKAFSKTNKENANKYIKTLSAVKDEDIMKNSKKIKEITYGTDVYPIYETIYKNVSAFNYGGSVIYVENGFFDLPTGYQLAILYHEIGHDQCGHFRPAGWKRKGDNSKINIDVADETELIKRIQKDLSKFMVGVYNSAYANQPRYHNGEEFVYLLLEWEADRFSANIVGKSLMKHALKSHFSDSLKNRPTYRDPKKQKNHYNFNMDRMNIRTNAI